MRAILLAVLGCACAVASAAPVVLVPLEGAIGPATPARRPPGVAAVRGRAEGGGGGRRARAAGGPGRRGPAARPPRAPAPGRGAGGPADGRRAGRGPGPGGNSALA